MSDFETINSFQQDNILKFPRKPIQPPDYGLSNRNFTGPISSKMWATVSKLKSNYPDTFDWSMYDQIYEKFGDEQPRGGVVFRTNFKLVNHHSSCSKCHYAFELDTYGRGCIHNCTFCYAKDQLTTYGYWNRPHPFPVDLSEIRKIMCEVFETDKPNKWRSILEKKTPLRIGSMSDSFMWMDKKYKVSQELLKILNFYEYPHIVFTRSDLIATDDYINLLDKRFVSVQFSISGNNEELTRKMEPGAPSVAKRLAALKKLNEAGLWTTVRINPLFPIHPDGYFSKPEAVAKRFGSLDAAPKFDLLDWNFFDQLQEAKVPSVLAGFVRLSGQAINRISDTTGVDFKSFFDADVMASRGDKHYSDAEISYYYRRIAKEAALRKIRFNTCYIGNGIKDYFNYQNLWANKSDCCDAKGNVKAFTGVTSQNVQWEERVRHASCVETALKTKAMEQDFESNLLKNEAQQNHKSRHDRDIQI